MRSAALLICMLLTLIASVVAQSDDPDTFSISIVRNALASRAGEAGIINSWSQKQLARLGDATSVALIRILDERDMANPATVRYILQIIRDSFVGTELITSEENRKPKVTLFLLNYLRQINGDATTQEAIERTRDHIKKHAAQ
jgi:hypothetical protein